MLLRHLAKYYPNHLDEVSPQKKHGISCTMRTNHEGCVKILRICLENGWVIKREGDFYNLTDEGYEYLREFGPMLEKIYSSLMKDIRNQRY